MSSSSYKYGKPADLHKILSRKLPEPVVGRRRRPRQEPKVNDGNRLPRIANRPAVHTSPRPVPVPREQPLRISNAEAFTEEDYTGPAAEEATPKKTIASSYTLPHSITPLAETAPSCTTLSEAKLPPSRTNTRAPNPCPTVMHNSGYRHLPSARRSTARPSPKEPLRHATYAL